MVDFLLKIPTGIPGKEIPTQPKAARQMGPGPALENLHRSGVQLSESPASLCIMWTQFRDSLYVPGASQHYGIEGLKWGPELVPHYAERRQFLGQPKYIFAFFESGPERMPGHARKYAALRKLYFHFLSY